jgi:hypothetical protein
MREYPSKTYSRPTCEGHIYITIITKDDKFHSILIEPPSKSNDCGGSFVSAISDLLTFAIRRANGKEEIKAIVKGLSGHYCMGMRPNKHHCKSCSDAISQIIKEELLNEVPAKEVLCDHAPKGELGLAET